MLEKTEQTCSPGCSYKRSMSATCRSWPLLTATLAATEVRITVSQAENQAKLPRDNMSGMLRTMAAQAVPKASKMRV